MDIETYFKLGWTTLRDSKLFFFSSKSKVGFGGQEIGQNVFFNSFYMIFSLSFFKSTPKWLEWQWKILWQMNEKIPQSDGFPFEVYRCYDPDS